MRFCTWSPEVDVLSRGGTFVARVDLPGVPLSAVRVEISDDALTVSGERQDGRFFRRIALPAGAWLNKACANVDGGVLEIRIPVEMDEATELGSQADLPVFGLTAA